MKKTALFIFMVMMVAQQASAHTTYYVDPLGSDSNPGTYAEPWQTIQYGVNHIASGDTLIVREGDYWESSGVTITPNRNPLINGTEERYTTIKAEGSVRIFTNSGQVYGVWLYGLSSLPIQYVCLSGFTIVNQEYGWAIALNQADHCIIEKNNCSVRNRSISYGNLSGSQRANGAVGIKLYSAHNCIIRSNNCSNIFAWGAEASSCVIAGIRLDYSDNNLISGNICEHIASLEYSLPTAGIYLLESNNNTVEKNFLHDFHQSGHGAGGAGFAVAINERYSNGTIVKNNRIFGNSERLFYGIATYSNDENAVIYIYNNIFEDFSKTLSMRSKGTTLFYNNILIHCKFPVYHLSEHFVFSNNVFYYNNYALRMNSDTIDGQVVNNIFIDDVFTSPIIWIYSDIIESLVIDYNATGEDVQQLSYYENEGDNNIYMIDPLFRDAQNYNFQMSSLSPCKGAGNDGSDMGLFGGEYALVDTDNDGLPDDWEDEFGLSTHLQNDTQDPDCDGLINIKEYYFMTDPLLYDTDNDGLSDGDEVAAHSNPLAPDTDFDHISDFDELALGLDPYQHDTDGDALWDSEEIDLYHTDPLIADTDTDGLTDYQELFAWSTWGFTSDPLNPDTDFDGINDGDEVSIHSDPDNDQQLFQMLSCTKTESSLAKLTWQCPYQPASCSVYYKYSAAEAWQKIEYEGFSADIQNNVIPGTTEYAGTKSWIDPYFQDRLANSTLTPKRIMYKITTP